MNLYAQMIAAVVDAAATLAGVTIRYSRGEASTTIDGVLLGRASDLADTEDPNSPRIEHSDRDFLFSPAAIVLAGIPAAPPQYNDQITILDTDHPDCGLIFEVLPTGDERPWRSCDAWDTRIRVFTRQVTS